MFVDFIMDKIKIANIVRTIARYTLLVLSIIVFIFALISGSESYGGGIIGVMKNNPNTLPWLILLLFIYIAWKWELMGGIIITLLGIVMVYFFNVGPNFWLTTFILTLLIVIMGLFLILSWYLRKDLK